MQFFFQGKDPVDLQIPGDYIKYTIYPSEGVQTLAGNPRLGEFIFSQDNPFRDLFKSPEELQAPPVEEKKKSKKSNESLSDDSPE